MTATDRPRADRRERFERLTWPLMPALHRTALRLVFGHDEAADLVQEAYLRAYRTFDNFRPGTNAKAWMFTILYSVFVNEYRKRKRRPREVSVEELETRYDRALELPDESAHLAILQNPGLEWKGSEVEQAIARLPEAFRVAVLLVDVEELTYEEAAAVAECPIGTIRSRLYRGRKLLAVELAEYARKQGFLRPSDDG